MRIIAKRTLRAYWEREPRAEQPLKAWYAIAAKADWSSPADVKAVYGNASIVGNDGVVFNMAMSLSLLKFVGQASLVDDAMLPS